MATAQATSAPSARAPRSPVGIIFLTIFLDLVGFSIIFPLFPKMLQYYLPTAGQTGWMADTVHWLSHLSGGTSSFPVEVLFGGLLGSLYSVLQFFFSPFWGRLSDKLGRRTVLLGTVAGTALSYLLWIFAGQFWVLVLARGLGGVMAGNVSVGTAAIADVTTPEKRSRGMALVGIAFGLGFILGPALGGWLSLYDITAMHRGAIAYGMNPFSICATAAFALAVLNFIWVLKRFPETLPVEKRASHMPAEQKTPTVRERLEAIFSLDNPAVHRANLVALFYTIAFSGMEFTLTFLAAERFNYSPRQMVYIFVFMGLVMVVAQGWLGRKYVPKWGERPSAIFGLVCGMAGFLILAFAMRQRYFYPGLAVFAVSAGLTSICLPSLVSLYSGASTQGRHIGSARAAQALGRAIGPLFSALIYFWAGAKMSYSVGAVALLIPVWLALRLPTPDKGPAANPAH
jgi:MFS family permease